MALISWSESLSVKIQEFDVQHQRLVRMLNELYDAMKGGTNKERISSIIAGLATYTAEHFAAEEKHFAKLGYPDAAEHITQHRLFTDQVAEFRRGFDEGRNTLSMEVMNFLSQWLRAHIMGTDQKYVPFLKAKGLR